MTTIDQIILIIGIIAILIAILHIVFLWATRQPEDTGFDLPPTDLDGRDAQGSAYGVKGGSHE
jgi:FtsZ-interacting cell division protein ZipA